MNFNFNFSIYDKKGKYTEVHDTPGVQLCHCQNLYNSLS